MFETTVETGGSIRTAGDAAKIFVPLSRNVHYDQYASHTLTRGSSMQLDLTVNGEPKAIEAAPDDDLASVLRREGYTGVKCGCDGGVCGASKVLLDGDAVMACGETARDADGATIETVEGLGTQDDLHPIQQAFVDTFAVQCGFCIPGMIIQAKELLDETPNPSEAEVREAIDDNLCRCTGYQKPVEAILDAADRLNGDGAVATDGGDRPQQ
ncbi:carbon-monoxide dehydrogenase small subunit [Natrinema salifodinae]|uniref:Carbon-monoxide dehydrogenase small subunit n=2 Tax=Natrinema salifodinae TaxID=1202768 RepID=A0A1I0QR66_9EURY|nr:carbon-monoxide dehydrogenase small subunit [Natrinema salifodinae]